MRKLAPISRKMFVIMSIALFQKVCILSFQNTLKFSSYFPTMILHQFISDALANCAKLCLNIIPRIPYRWILTPPESLWFGDIILIRQVHALILVTSLLPFHLCCFNIDQFFIYLSIILKYYHSKLGFIKIHYSIPWEKYNQTTTMNST